VVDDLTPYLYDSSESSFLSNGIGNLADAAKCKVKEQRNGEFELEMEYPVSGILFDQIRIGRYITARPAPFRDQQPFEIYKITKPMDGLVTIYAQHISYRLSKIPLNPFTAEDVQGAFQKIPQNVLEPCPFTFQTDKHTVAHYGTDIPASLRSRLGGSEGSFLDVYGGEYEFDGLTVKLWNQRGQNRGVEIVYGKNLIDLEQEESIESTITGAIAFWKGQDANEQEVVVQSDLQQSQYSENYAYHRTTVLDVSGEFQNQPTKQQLNNYVRTYLTRYNIGIPAVNLDLKFVDLRDTEEYVDTVGIFAEDVRLCDTVTVRFEELGVNASAKVIETTYDVLAEHYDEIKLGDPKTKFTDTVADVEKKSNEAISQTDLQAAVANATAQITGAAGGWIVDRYDSDGNRYEMLIMDTNDIHTARNVWRFNQNGWAHSSTGYNGSYTLAATQDGAIVADLITSGTLNANIIRAGIIRGQVGNSYWNLATGEIYIESYATQTNVENLVNSTKTEIESELTREINSLSSSIAATYARADDVEAEFDEVNGHWEAYITDDSGNYICDSSMNRMIAVREYFTTDRTRSLIEQTADSITLKVEGYHAEANREYAELSSQIVVTESSILQEVSKKTTDSQIISSIQNKIDNDGASITFRTGNLIVDSSNFKLDRSGNATFSGNITGSTISGSSFESTSGNYKFKITGASFKFYNNNVEKAEMKFGDWTYAGTTYVNDFGITSPSVIIRATSASGLDSLALHNSGGGASINLTKNVSISTSNGNINISAGGSGNYVNIPKLNASSDWRFAGSYHSSSGVKVITDIQLDSDGTVRQYSWKDIYIDHGIIVGFS
jgi:phage minor structural protein